MNFGYKLSILYSFIYVFDEIFYYLIGYNVGSISILLLVTLFYFFIKNIKVNFKVSSIKFLVLIILFGTFASISSYGCNLTQKGFLSYILLIPIVLFFHNIKLVDIYTNKIVVYIITTVIILLLILDTLGFGIENNVLIANRNSGSYFEPSHLAIYILPILAIGIVLYGFMSSYVLLMLSILLAPSTTLFIGTTFLIPIILSSLNLSSSKKYLILLLILLVSFIGFNLIDMSMIEERISGVISGVYSGDRIDSSYNLSSLVWLNGWSQAWNTFTQTMGLGLGFNQMGCNNFDEIGSYTTTIKDITEGINLNFQDGSILAAKVISEFGIFGMILLLMISLKLLKVISKFFTNNNLKNLDYINMIGAINVVIILFIRTPGGYFQIPILLATAMLIYKNKYEFNSNK